MRLYTHRILHGETRILAKADLEKVFPAMEQAVVRARGVIRYHMALYPEFRWSLEPIEKPRVSLDPVISEMYEAAQIAEVGPFASVAGAIAQAATLAGMEAGAREILVENGGDICLYGNRPYLVGIYAGGSPLSEKIALRINPGGHVRGLCTSSSTVGESISFGEADAVVVYHPSSAAIADALATSICNEVRGVDGLSKGISKAKKIGMMGVMIIRGKEMTLWGDLPELVRISGTECDLVARPQTHSRAPA